MANEKHPVHERQSLLVAYYFERMRQDVRTGKITPENNPAYRRLLEEAQSALLVEPLSVTHKKHMPPSGDKRDYWSLSIYFWPNEETPDGLPYAPRDGVVNPEIYDYDRPNFVATCGYVDTLSIAFALGGREEFAAKAMQLLRTWFIDEKTRMNPNMLFAQYIPGDEVEVPWKEYPARYVPGTDGRKGIYVSYGGVIEDLNLVSLTDCILLLRESKYWSTADDATLIQWYRDYTEWLLTHQHGLDEAACRNNHGSWYWADILCFLNFTGQQERARELANKIFLERLQMQFEADGSQPEELGRAISQSYCVFSLCSFTNMALSCQDIGFSVWDEKTEDGRSISKAMDWFMPYLTGEKEWVWKQIKPFHGSSMAGPLSALAYGTGQQQYRDAIMHSGHLGVDDRNRLLYHLI